MFYAHQGSSTDNAFSTIDGAPTRSFVAFDTKAELKEYQDKVWKESNGERNVILCKRKFVESFYGRNFFVAGNDVYPDYDTYMDSVN